MTTTPDLEIFDTISAMTAWSLDRRRENRRIGLVPTMGALHKGHAALIERAVQECDDVVVTIFVNPAQFGPQEDLQQYPRHFEEDCQTCKQVGATAVFAPTSETMYPDGFSTHITNTRLNQILCGMGRPGHFDGVALVCTKLFHIVQPHAAYFGQKDYQQLRVIHKTVDDLNIPVAVVDCPTVREPDGLAMSSRNKYLTKDQRQAASSLQQSLQAAKQWIRSGERDGARIKARMRAMISNHKQCDVEYIAIVDADNLLDRPTLEGTIVIALGVHVGITRLIDNIRLQV